MKRNYGKNSKNDIIIQEKLIEKTKIRKKRLCRINTKKKMPSSKKKNIFN